MGDVLKIDSSSKTERKVIGRPRLGTKIFMYLSSSKSEFSPRTFKYLIDDYLL